MLTISPLLRAGLQKLRPKEPTRFASGRANLPGIGSPKNPMQKCPEGTLCGMPESP
jgi:hypothetical protein